jgi:hypothetical protein
MVWWTLSDETAEGGVLEFERGWELHVYEQRGRRYPVWISDDAAFYRRVEMGLA